MTVLKALPIPDDDRIHRAFFDGVISAPIDDHAAMSFHADRKNKNRRAESVYWDRYIPDDTVLHTCGRKLEATKNQRLLQSGIPALRYLGARTAVVGKVRRLLVGATGAHFRVDHDPLPDGDCCGDAHSEILLIENSKNGDKNDRRVLIGQLFSLLSGIRRPADTTLHGYTPPVV